MKILIPRSSPFGKDRDPFDCSRFECDKFYVNGKKQKRFFQKKKKTSSGCVRYHCGIVNMTGTANLRQKEGMKGDSL